MKNYHEVYDTGAYELWCNGEVLSYHYSRYELYEAMRVCIDKDKSERKAQLYEILSQDCSIEKKLEMVGNMLL